MRRAGAALVGLLRAGDVVLLDGPLGSGKTTFVKGALEGLGHRGIVRSPTFNLLQVFETSPPVLHADLYRVPSERGLGIEEYLETHLCFIEWAERASPAIDRDHAWRIRFEFADAGRRIWVDPPSPG